MSGRLQLDALVQRAPQLILDSFDQGILALDRDERVIFGNRKAEEILKTPSDELSGRRVEKVLNVPTEKWLEVRREDRFAQPQESLEIRLTVDEAEVVLRPSVMMMRDEAGNRAGSVVFLEDVTDSAAEEEQQKKLDRLISLGELSACVAHEIRNPLTGIRTTVQFVASKLKPQDPRKEDLDDVIKELDRIETIISGLLQFARPQVSRPGPTDVSALVGRVLDNLELQFKAAGVQIARDFCDEPAHVWTDPDLLQQVVLNLGINAMQAMPEGGTLKVGLGIKRYRTKKSMVDLVLADTGPGIPPEVFEKIFDPFFTTRPLGTGLGLPISLQIVREQGGALTARNLPSGGAQFTVRLPLVNVAAQAEGA
ncbi:MAG: PAS domain-containing protein [Candidatus Eisenbacteria bacterium]|nr:PAS domain-containing protein [Candidatus Eisenbacteria bacterium]